MRVHGIALPLRVLIRFEKAALEHLAAIAGHLGVAKVPAVQQHTVIAFD